ncbi:MAG: tRNA uridine-5-carboxymethylaminomethyl(34) synthesis GTPase MnmE, partial [Prevotellaceae bacterium]|nr:tRNA uridine-5-carboxymethylaminomethyl(34) synthesis GTPase MnmE [Prevotellaceae bacterium]
MTKITDLIETDNKTICAIATTEGTSALGIVRLSGPLAHHIVNKIFKPTSNECLLPRRVYFGKVFDKERLIDDVIVHISIAPFSFTGEDCAEISCHGSSYVLHEVMSLAMENGATPALPGEFTQRAFLNGKIDLAQAEAIADLIASENEAAHRVAIQQMRGGFSLEISKLRSALIDFTSLIELELDFGEEDVQFADRNQLQNILAQPHQ